MSHRFSLSYPFLTLPSVSISESLLSMSTLSIGSLKAAVLLSSLSVSWLTPVSPSHLGQFLCLSVSPSVSF